MGGVGCVCVREAKGLGHDSETASAGHVPGIINKLSWQPRLEEGDWMVGGLLTKMAQERKTRRKLHLFGIMRRNG